MEEINEEGLENILKVMEKKNGREEIIERYEIKIEKEKERKKRKIGDSLRKIVGKDRIGVMILDEVIDEIESEEIRKNMIWEVGMEMIEIERKKLKRKKEEKFKVEKKGEKEIGIIEERKEENKEIKRI